MSGFLLAKDPLITYLMFFFKYKPNSLVRLRSKPKNSGEPGLTTSLPSSFP